jgi:hypothetical protein
MRWVDLTAILKNLGAARAVRSLGIQTGVDYSPTHNLSVERAISRAGIGLSMNAKLLEELQQHHIVSESTEHLTQNIAPEQPKKRFILF